MLGKEALVVLANLSRLMEVKMEGPISHVCGWVNGRIEILVIRLYSCVICGPRIPSPLWYRDPDWGLGSGI